MPAEVPAGYTWCKPSELATKGKKAAHLFLKTTGIYMLRKYTSETLPDNPSKRQKIGTVIFALRSALCAAQCAAATQLKHLPT